MAQQQRDRWVVVVRSGFETGSPQWGDFAGCNNPSILFKC